MRAWLQGAPEHGTRDEPISVVLALPRGGVPVGYEVARHLHAPLDVLVVRKLGAPRHPEFAIGAVAGGGITVLDDAFIAVYLSSGAGARRHRAA